MSLQQSVYGSSRYTNIPGHLTLLWNDDPQATAVSGVPYNFSRSFLYGSGAGGRAFVPSVGPRVLVVSLWNADAQQSASLPTQPPYLNNVQDTTNGITYTRAGGFQGNGIGFFSVPFLWYRAVTMEIYWALYTPAQWNQAFTVVGQYSTLASVTVTAKFLMFDGAAIVTALDGFNGVQSAVGASSPYIVNNTAGNDLLDLMVFCTEQGDQANGKVTFSGLTDAFGGEGANYPVMGYKFDGPASSQTFTTTGSSYSASNNYSVVAGFTRY